MRVVLALMAVLALLVSPVTAAAAQVACDQAGPAAMASMDMPGVAEAAAQKSMADPCCDHGAKHPMDQKSCALACAASCAVTAALPGPVVGSILVFSTAQLTPARLAPAHPYEPAGLIRPPKSMA